MSVITLERAEERLNKLDKMSELHAYIEEGGAAKETAEKVYALHDEVGELPAAPSVFRNFPKFPTGGEEMQAAKQATLTKKKILLPLAVATVVFFLLSLLTHVTFFNTVAAIGLMALVLFAVQYFSRKGKYEQLKKDYDREVDTYNKTLSAFRTALRRYDEEKTAGLAVAQEYGVRYKEAYAAYTTLLDQYGANKSEAMEEFVTIGEEVYGDKDFATDYDPYLHQIVNYMRSGRAESYKEALNLAIAEERAERAEAERRSEEARRIAIMERQAEEERRHNQEMEREQQMHDRMMQDEQRKLAESQRPKTLSSHPLTWQNDKEYVPSVGCYRDKNGNYYSSQGLPIPPPVTISDGK